MQETGSLINKANSGKAGEKKYLIGAQWWQTWCDYVNFEAIATGIGRENIDFKLNNDLLFKEEREAPAYFSVPPKKRQGVDQLQYHQKEEELLPSESARMRLTNFRAELQNLKQRNDRKLIDQDLMKSKNIYAKPSIVNNE